MKTSKEMQVKILEKVIRNIQEDKCIREDIEVYHEVWDSWGGEILSPGNSLYFEFDDFEYRVKPEIRKFKVKHSKDIVSFDIEIDMSAKAYWPLVNYRAKSEGDSIKTDIIAMSLFWSGSPSKEASFEDHLKFFLNALSRNLTHYIISKSSSQKNAHKYMNQEEGYIPIFGKHINITNIKLYNDYVSDELRIEEVA